MTLGALLFAIAQPVLAITHVTLIDGTGRAPLNDQTLIVEGETLAYVGKSSEASIPRGAKVIDGKGKFVIPGLWDMHTHLDDPELLELKPTKTEKELQLPLMVVNGVTGVRDMGGDLDLFKEWRARIKAGKLIGPRLYFTGPLVDGPEPMWPASVAVKDEAEARTAVRVLKKRGADLIKVYSLLRRDSFFALADECKKENIPFAGHVPTQVQNTEAVEAGMRSIEHLLQLDRELADPAQVDELRKNAPKGLTRTQQFKGMREIYEKAFSESKLQELLALLKKHKTWVTPTLNVVVRNATFDATDKAMLGRAQYEPAYIREWWNPDVNVHLKEADPDLNQGQLVTLRIYQRIVRAMKEAGVPILVGSDMGGNPHCFAGWGVHDEMALLVETGLTPMDAIVAATSEPCRFLGIDQKLGTLQKGKLADLVLLDEDPLTDIRNVQKIRAVVQNGRLFSRVALDGLLDTAKRNGSDRIPPKGPEDTIEKMDPIRFGGD